MERRAQVQFNRYVKDGMVAKKYVFGLLHCTLRLFPYKFNEPYSHSQVLTLILRLRQLCCHPNLVYVRGLCNNTNNGIAVAEFLSLLSRVSSITSATANLPVTTLPRRSSPEP